MFNCNCDSACDCETKYVDYDVLSESDCESESEYLEGYDRADNDWECNGECEYGECDCHENTRHFCTDCFGCNWDHCDYCSAKKRILIDALHTATPDHLSELRRMFRLFKPLEEIEQKVAEQKVAEQKAAAKRPAGDEDSEGLPRKKIRVV